MKMKGFWKKVITHVLTIAMLVSIFSTVDMGWNVREVKAADYEYTRDLTQMSTGPQRGPDVFLGWFYFDSKGYGLWATISDTSSNTFLQYNSIYGLTWNDKEGVGKNLKFYLEGLPAEYSVTKFEFTGYISGNTRKTATHTATNNSVTISVKGTNSWGNFLLAGVGGDEQCIGIKDIKITAHKHNWSNTWKTNEEDHWKECTDNPSHKKDSAKHSGGTATCTQKATCITCGRQYGNLATNNHDYNRSKWEKDATNHWHACTGNTSHKTDVTAHSGGTATCTQKATCSTCGQSYGDFANHVFSYSANDNVITATCSREGCPYKTNGITLTLDAADKTYTGSAYTGASIGDWSKSETGLASKPAVSDIKYYELGESEALGGAPIDVGSYTAKLTVGSATATKEFSITKKNIATDDVTITRDDAVYDGTGKAAVVTKKDTVTGTGNITVKYQKKNGDTWDAETDEAPVNAGKYQVVAYVTGGDNFNESHVAVKTFTIDKATPSITTTPSFNNTITYGTLLREITLGTDGVAKLGENVVPGTFAWKTGTTKPVVSDTNSTDFPILFTPEDSENYNTCETGVKLTISKAAPAAPSAGVGYKIDYVEETLVADPDDDFEVSSSNGETATSLDADKVVPGQTYYVRYKANDNQEKSGWTEINVAQRPAAPTESVVVERMGNSITLQMIPGVEYSLDGTNWFIDTNAGSNVTVADGKITFAGLTEDTDCTVYSRVKATNDAPNPHFRSNNTTQTVKTKKKLPDNLTTLFDFTPPEGGNPIYDKQPKEADVEKKYPYTGIGEPVIKYYDKDGNPVDKPKDAGEYTVTVSAPPTDDYPAVPETEIGKFTIAKKTITIAPTAGQSKVYGTADPVIAYTAEPALCEGDTFTGGLTYTGAGMYTGVGSYEIVNNNLSAGNNYELTLTTGVNFEITKANYTTGPATGIGYTIDYVAETMTVTSDADFELSSTNTDDATPLVDNNVTPGETYYIRHKGNDNQNESPWTEIKLPNRPAAPNAVGKQETVMNKKDAEITSVNSTMEYYFDADGVTTPTWIDVSGNKIENPDNKNITIRVKASNTNKNFYGLEKTIEFTPSETKLKVRLGDTVIEVPYGGTIPVDKKPQDPTPPTGQVFMHWAFGGDKWNFDGEKDGDGDSLTPSEVTGDILLVPVWGVEINGIITAQDYDSITEVSLVDGKGNKYKHYELTKQEDNTYKYSVIAPAGVDYNLVIEGVKKINNAARNITKTQLINLNKDGGGDVTMPVGSFSSKVTKENAGSYENTLVGGLDTIADSHNGDSDVVLVELKVSATVNNENEIKTAIKDKTLEFVELTLEKTVNGGVAQNIGSDNTQLLQIIIPYETEGKYNIEVYRYHDGKVDTITTNKNSDGEYIEIGEGTITIFAMKFSTYAIGYSDKPAEQEPGRFNGGSFSQNNSKKPDKDDDKDPDKDNTTDPDDNTDGGLPPTNNGDTNNSNNANGGNSSPYSGGNKKSPKTGDAGSPFAWSIIMIAGLGVLWGAGRKRKKEES